MDTDAEMITIHRSEMEKLLTRALVKWFEAGDAPPKSLMAAEPVARYLSFEVLEGAKPPH